MAAILLGALSSAAPGCRPATVSSHDRTVLRSVSLPDLAGAAEPVRVQLRESDAFLTRTIQDPHASASDLANAYGAMGKLLMAAEYREQVEACFLNAEWLAPNEYKWPYYLGHFYKARGDAVKSTAAFERALRAQPDDGPTLVWLGNAYLDQGRPEAAQPLFERVMSQQSQSIAALVGLGRAALGRSDYARAAQTLERALALDPRQTVIHYPLAMAYRGLGQLDKAEAHMRQRGSGEIRPPDPLMVDLETTLESAIAYEVRGAKALDERDWQAAAASFRKGIALAPDEPSLHHKLGTALFMSGDARGATEQFEEALRLSPHFAKAHYSLGILMGATGRPARAIEHLTAAVGDDPASAEARLRLGDVLRRSGRAAQSLPYYEQASNLDPRLAEASFGYAMALFDLRRYREARDRLLDAMKLYPDEPGFAHAAVRLLAASPDDRVRDGRAAMSIMQDLVAHGPRSPDVDEMMAMTLAELGRYADAIAWQKDAIAGAERAGLADLAQRMAENLAHYEHRQPCRTPWRDETALVPG
jgi:tetratricopeptide (TPR) repeat protein